MEKKGLIERQSVDSDARLRKIVLTDKARSVTELVACSGADMERALVAGMSQEDLERFAGYLARMKSNLAATGLVDGDCGRNSACTASSDAEENVTTKDDKKEGKETI